MRRFPSPTGLTSLSLSLFSLCFSFSRSLSLSLSGFSRWSCYHYSTPFFDSTGPSLLVHASHRRLHQQRQWLSTLVPLYGSLYKQRRPTGLNIFSFLLQSRCGVFLYSLSFFFFILPREKDGARDVTIEHNIERSRYVR